MKIFFSPNLKPIDQICHFGELCETVCRPISWNWPTGVATLAIFDFQVCCLQMAYHEEDGKVSRVSGWCALGTCRPFSYCRQTNTEQNKGTGMSGLATKWVRSAPNGTTVIGEPKNIEIWSEKVPDLSHLGPIWPTLNAILTQFGTNFKQTSLQWEPCVL